jgi:hypothetical protein
MADKRPKGRSGVQFLMDFDIAGTNRIWYPRVKRRSHNLDRRYRYAIGMADLWILKALKIPTLEKHPKFDQLPMLPLGKRERLFLDNPNFDPEKGVIRIEKGIPHRITLAEPISTSGRVVESLEIRIPTWVNSRQLFHWLKSENGPLAKDLLHSMQVAGYDPSTATVDPYGGYYRRETLSFRERYRSYELIDEDW